ncbi:MAG: metallophosphoesterase [Alphaproteobacteria bacterium]|nr:metallophosphoesterase [Alphaproteobacteria bacterium]
MAEAKRRRRWLWRSLGALVLIGALLAVYAVAIEPGRLVVRETRLGLFDWPAERDGYRIAVLADLHVGSPHVGLEKLAQVVAETNALKPDLIVLAGDYVIDGVIGGGKVDMHEIAPVLARLSAPEGVYAVLGNHDNWNDPAHIAAELEANGIPVLEARKVMLKAGVWLVGIPDAYTRPYQLDRAMEGVKGPAIALTHTPDIFPQIPSTVMLTIAGHTHGGQVYVPLLGRPVVPSRYGQRYAMGAIVENGHTLFVSAGIGTSIFPVRFLTPPEIDLLILHRES